MSRGAYPPLVDLQAALACHPETGVLMWRVSRGRCGKGSLAGSPSGADGCLTLKLDGRLMRAHCVVWMLSGQEIPPGKRVEHINGDVTDNRLENLQLTRDFLPITAELLRGLFSYTPETGTLTLLRDYGDRVTGDASTINHGQGYQLVVVEGKNCLAHRVAWAIVNGEWLAPTVHIDHINGLRHDNRIANLRLVSRAENMQNMHVGRNGAISGAHYDATRGKWKASISVNNKVRFLGRYDTEEEARAVYLAAKQRLHAPNVLAGTITPLPAMENMR